MADLGSTKVFGDLTVAGDIRIGGAQSTDAAACTRKDYVDSAIAAGDALQVSKSGDTMTGNLTAPAVLVSSAQNTSVNALTRKDYVDSQVATRAPTAHTHTVANVDGLQTALDGKSATSHTHTAADVGAVAKTGDTMTGGLTFVNANCELGWSFNTDYAKIGFKNTGDGDTDSYMWFKTGDNGNEYFKWQGVSGANTADWMSLKSTGLVVAAGVTAPTFTGALDGNAATATKLATARQINGTDFDGSGNITTVNWGTARTLTIGNSGKSVNGGVDVSWSLSEIGAARARGELSSGATENITTDQFVQWLKDSGAFAERVWIARGSWSYANNKTITDTGCGNIHLAGCTIEVISVSEFAFTIRIITPTTTSGGGTTGAEFVYVNNGSAYSPGWRRIYTTAWKPNADDVGALPSGGTAVAAAKLATARTIAGVAFDGTANISLTAANVGAIATTGGTATGNITAPDFIQSSTQSTNAAACTRKDYVDSAIAAGDALQVSKSGDTMTGNLTAPKVLVSGAQGTEANALTRKDYVDGLAASKLGSTTNTVWNATGAGAGQGLAYSGKTAIGGVNDSWLRINPNSEFTSGIYCGASLLRTDGSFSVNDYSPTRRSIRLAQGVGGTWAADKIAFIDLGGAPTTGSTATHLLRYKDTAGATIFTLETLDQGGLTYLRAGTGNY